MISLFTGAGGLDAGMDATGKFNLLAAAEWDSASCRTLEMNRDAGRFGTAATRIYEVDLSAMDPHQLLDDLGLEPGELDVLVGGPPCQSFSTAGRRGTVQDPRGQLLWHFLRFVEVLRPKMFLVENVRGLLSAALRHRPIADRPDKGGAPLTADEQPGSVVKTWIADILALNDGEYRVDSFEVNAVNYGAPQLRERVLFIGNRLGRSVEFPAPTHGTGDGLLPFRTLADALRGFVEEAPVMMDFSPRKKSFLAYVPEGGNWRAMPEHIQQESMGRAFYAKGGRSGWWRRLSWDLPCPTITTLPNHSSTSMCHPTETRVLSVGECARVQEFPEGWVFAGTAAQQMKQVGNAVPARLGRVAGELIAAHLHENSRSDSSPVVELAGWTNTYLRSHVRTRSWWKNGQAVVRERSLAS
jgi:DNA (cytosine-5)-methyltransferase 1